MPQLLRYVPSLLLRSLWAKRQQLVTGSGSCENFLQIGAMRVTSQGSDSPPDKVSGAQFHQMQYCCGYGTRNTINKQFGHSKV